MLREFRLYLHAMFLDWAFGVMPAGPEKVEFAKSLISYLKGVWLDA